MITDPVRSATHSLFQHIDGFFVLFFQVVSNPEKHEIARGPVGIESNRGLQGMDAVIYATGPDHHLTTVTLGKGVVGIELDGPIQLVDCQLISAPKGINDPKQGVSIGVKS